MRLLGLILAAVVASACGVAGPAPSQPAASSSRSQGASPSPTPSTTPPVTADPTRPPADIAVRLTDRECEIQAPPVVAAGRLRVDVENASSYGADVNIIRGIPEAEGGLPFDELVRRAKKVVSEANEAIQAGREPTWEHGEYFETVPQDIVLDSNETGRITATMKAGTGFFLCFLGYSDSERLPVFLSPPFVVE